MQEVKNEMKKLKPVYEYIEMKNNEMTTEQIGDEDIMNKKISQLKLYWAKVDEKLKTRENVLSVLLPATDKHRSTKTKFLSRKKTVELKINAIQAVPAEATQVLKQYRTLQVCIERSFHSL